MILDAGVDFKEVQKALNFNFRNVLGVLVTHEHKDHCKYLTNFALNGINIYASAGTFEKLNLKGHRFISVKKLQQFNIGDFIILPFDTQHDAQEPLGFLIQYKPTGEKLLYATDTYYIKYNYLFIQKAPTDISQSVHNLLNILAFLSEIRKSETLGWLMLSFLTHTGDYKNNYSNNIRKYF